MAFATAFVSLVGGTFLIYFIKDLGGGDAWVGLLGALPALAGLSQIPGAAIGRGFTGYRRYVAAAGWLWRFLHVPLVALPLLTFVPNDAKLTILALLIGLAWVCNQTAQPIYNDWIAETVPANSRGWYFGRRTIISQAVGVTIGLIGGLTLDYFKRNGQTEIGYATLFGLGLLCSFISMAFFLQMRDIVRANPVRQSVGQTLAGMAKPLRDRGFRPVIVFCVMFVVGQAFAGGLFVAFARESLALSMTQMQITQVSMALGMLLFASFWGYLADKYGNKPVMLILCVLLAFTPVMWLVVVPGQPTMSTIILTIGHVYSGAVWAGIMVCQLNLVMATAPAEERASYLGMALAAQALAGAASPMLGAATMTWLRTMHDPDFAYKVVFALTMALRFGSLMFLLPVREPGAVPIRQTLKPLLSINPRGVRALRKLSTSTDVERREHAIRQMERSGLSLGSSALVKALADPSPRVRRQAAQALAKIGDTTAGEALLQHLRRHPDLADEETLEALGGLHHPESVHLLVQYLTDHRAYMRLAAARTLGRLGDAQALAPLMNALADRDDPDLRRTALRSLRLLGRAECAPAVEAALFDPESEVRAAAAETVGELKLKASAEALRNSIRARMPQDPGEPAYALGAVGEPGDLATILELAETAGAAPSRRRCLLGAAALFDVEEDAYRLMMLDGFERDDQLMQLVRNVYRKSRRLREAFDLYAAGDEPGALRRLAGSRQAPMLATFADHPVEESFLVATLVYAKTSGIAMA